MDAAGRLNLAGSANVTTVESDQRALGGEVKSDPRIPSPGDAQSRPASRRRLSVRVAICGALAALSLGALPALAAATGSGQIGSASASGKVRVKEARHGARTILTTADGHTLYSLSVEKSGRFVCTRSSGCLTVWHPLVVPPGAALVGPVKLGKIERPDGGVQATFRGLPLYTFTGDKKAGQVKGDGVKDVGTWHPATVPTG
jgi:predicted lipoprotein with Yx(FWY)xxD motif